MTSPAIEQLRLALRPGVSTVRSLDKVQLGTVTRVDKTGFRALFGDNPQMECEILFTEVLAYRKGKNPVAILEYRWRKFEELATHDYFRPGSRGGGHHESSQNAT